MTEKPATKQEIRDAIIFAADREGALQGSVVIALLLTIAFAAWGPDIWFHGPDIGWSNVIEFILIWLVITWMLWWLIDAKK